MPLLLPLSLLLVLPSWLAHPTAGRWTVKPEWVRTHESFLASDSLHGRGTATRDEEIAATYVATRFEGFGLKKAPGMQSFIQEASVYENSKTGRLLLGSDDAVGTTTDRHTYNAVGFLPGKQSNAGTVLITAHLDHLGVGKPVAGDSIYNGADDDASGVTAVLELAHALASGPALRRSVLFVCFGSEEAGAVGSKFFREHSPISLDAMVANLEFEMIGAQDPKLEPGFLLFTGWERSNLGPTLRAHGAHLAPDPYPEQHYFQRSDNYALAQMGIVAQTAAGWGNPPFYHQPSDDLAHLDIDFLTAAIQSMVQPVRWLANSTWRPSWNPGGRPTPARKGFAGPSTP